MLRNIGQICTGRNTITRRIQCVIKCNNRNLTNLVDVRVVPVVADGNCQYRAVAQGLLGDQEKHSEVRMNVVNYLQTREDLNSFLVEEEFASWKDFLRHCSQDGAWGDHITLFGAASHYQINITVHYHENVSPPQIISPSDTSTKLPGIQILFYPDRQHYDALVSLKE